MDLITSLILLGIVIVLIILYVTWPLSSRRRPEVEGNQELSALQAEHDRVLNSLKELDFDNSLGKIPSEAYPAQRASLLQLGAEILRKIDQFAPVLEAVPSIDTSQEDQIEAILSARRAKQVTGAVIEEDAVERLVAGRRKIRTVKAGIYCPQCGRHLSDSDRFCPDCGHPIQ
jgi:hypothetical protein